MAEIAPLTPLRYALGKHPGVLGSLVAPPYDVISAEQRTELIARDPHNVVRLILPRPVAGQPGEEYRHAADSLRQWQDEGILIADPGPALYVYEQAAAAGASSNGQGRDLRVSGGGNGGTRAGMIQRGLIGALRLTPPDAGIVLPHEDVSPGPVAGRLQLMEATQANLEPIFLLYDGGTPDEPGATARLVTATVAGQPLVEAITADGVRHRLWALTDPGDLAAIAADLAPRQALIADGHHRYAAYLQLQDRRRRAGAGPGPWDYGLAMLVDSAAYPPRIGAIHRVVPDLDVHDAAKLAGAAFSVRSLPAGIADVPAAVSALADASADGPAFVVADGEHAYLLTDPDPGQARAAMPAGQSAQWRALPASVLQELLIIQLWGLTDDENTVRTVHHDARAAVRTAQEACGTAVLCSPMSPADVYAVAARGEKVPRKSTSFAPKPRTGLVLRTFAQS